LVSTQYGLQRDGDILIGNSTAAGARVIDIDKNLFGALSPVVTDIPCSG